MTHSKYSYGDYTIDYSIISKDEVYSQYMNTLFASSIAMFIRHNNIIDFNNVIIINSIKNNNCTDVFDEDTIRLAFYLFMQNVGYSNIILTELDKYDYSSDIFIELITLYTMLGFIAIDDIFPNKDRIGFILVNTCAKSFIRKLAGVIVENM